MKKKKSQKFKSPKLKKAIARLPSTKTVKPEDKLKGLLSEVSKITEETLPEHREEVLGSARKFIYPLKQSRRHFVRLSLAILSLAIVLFLAYTVFELYYFQSTSDFVYSVSEVIPFPVARAGPSWVSYYSYLFELRRNMHYYQTQQQANFSTTSGKAQLTSLKKQAMNQVTEDAYVKQLASKYDVSVSSTQVNNEIGLVKEENRLGNSNQVLESVLRDYWGWTLNDFKKELSQELLQQAVVAKLDTATDEEASNVHAQLEGGANFATEAQQYSDDTSTKSNGGQYPSTITPNTQSLAPQITAAIFSLKPGQISPVINSGYSLDIVKLISITGSSAEAAHIQFNFQPISTYTYPLEKANLPKEYISI